jgi:serine/threonine protein kinase/tetratricopeptide (TPR) repeat protein
MADLLAFSIGQLSAETSDAIASHIAACGLCLARLQAMDQDHDEVGAELRQPAPQELFSTTGQQAVQRLIAKVGELPGRPALESDDEEGTSPTEAAAPSSGQPPTRLGRFRILRALGCGTFGMVFLADDPQLHRQVALKVPRSGSLLTAELGQRFVREARAAAGLDHPNVVAVYEAGVVDNTYYIASAYCPGSTLAEWLKERKEPVPARLVATLGLTLAAAIHHAHSRGVIHRDLKPSNVLLQLHPLARATGPDSTLKGLTTGSDAPNAGFDFIPKVTDFGLAKLVPVAADGTQISPPTQSGAVLGTPQYMAPEQAGGRNREVGPAADVYALGVILYELLTGRPPFVGETALETLEQVRTQEPVSPRRLRPKLPRDLETICLKCLSKEPARRYGTAQTLADDLGRFLTGEPVRARPVGRLGRLARWSRRKPAVAALLAVSALAAVGLAAVSIAYNARLRMANAGLTRALQDTDKQRGYAEDNLRLARQSADRFVNRLSVDPRLRAHDLDHLRRDLLESAVPFYQVLTSRYSDDPNLTAEQGQSYLRLALIKAELGSVAEAILLFREAAAIFERLAHDHPTVADYSLEWANCLTSLGAWCEQAGQLGQAEDVYEQARDLRAAVVRAHPEKADYRSDLAKSYNNLGGLYRHTGRYEKAEDAHQRARDVRQRLVDAYPRVPHYQVSLAGSYSNLGVLYRQTGRHRQAEDAHRQALRLLEQLVRAEPTLPEHQKNLAMTHSNLAALYGDLDQWPLAEEQALKARDWWDGLARAHPHVPDYQAALAKGCCNLAVVYDEMGRQDRAEAAYRAARESQAKLVESFPAVPEYRGALAQMLCNLGAFYKNGGQLQRAIAPHQEARDLYAKLTSDQPSVPDYRAGLALSHGELGELYRLTGRPDLAAVHFDQARVLWEKLVGDHPTRMEFADGLAGTASDLGWLAATTGKPEAALEWYARAARGYQAVLDKEPRLALVRSHLCDVWRRRALTLGGLGRHSEALQDWERALALAKPPVRDTVRIQRALTLARVGQHFQAAAEADARAKQASLAGQDIYDLASVYALATAAVRKDNRLTQAVQQTRADQYATRALELLAKAHAANYFKDPAAVESLRKNKDLDPLRLHADFRRFLADMEARAEHKPKVP